jgi:transposase
MIEVVRSRTTRAVLNGILWVLGTEAQWRELPRNYPPYQTCHHRFQQWVREGKLERILHVLAEKLQARGKLQLEEAFIDASFTGAKKGVSRSAPPNAARGRKSSLSPMITVFLSPLVSKALRRESRLVEGVLGQSFLDTLPARLIGDKAYDSDRLDRDLAKRCGIELTAPNRGDRRTPTRDGRPLRCYRRRGRVEPLFAWLHHFRRLVIRWEYHVENLFGMVRLGCMQILLRYL